MKFASKFLLSLFLLLAPTWAQNTASDPFTGTGSLSGSWTIADGSPSIISDELGGADSDYNWAYWSAISWDPDQASRVIAGTYGTDAYHVLVVRASGQEETRDAYLYSWTQAGGNNADVYRFVDGVSTKIVNLAETYGVANPGDEVELKVEGSGTSTLLTVSINGSPIFTHTDNSGSALETGAPGCGTFRTSSRIASWEAEDFGSGGGTTPAGRATLLGVGR